MINISLGLEKQKVQRWASRRKPHGVLPLPRGLSLRPILHHGSSCLCQICFLVPRTTPWHLPGIHQFRPTSCGSFPAAFKPPWATRLSLSFLSQPPFLEELFIFTVSLPCLPLTLSLSVVWLPTATQVLPSSRSLTRSSLCLT